MGSVNHEFMPPLGADDTRCGRVMPSGDPCSRPEASHKADARGWKERKRVDRRKGDRHINRPKKADQPLIFFDTEGKGDGAEHHLVYGAAVDENGLLIHEVDSKDGKTQPPPEAWLDALLAIGKKTRQRSVFSFGFGYDRTKMLEGLPPRTLYMFTHREKRPPSRSDPKRPEPLYWGDYILDLQGTRFSIAKLRRQADGRALKSRSGKRVYDRMTVWDVLKFFQCPFVNALDAWRWKGDAVDKKGKPKPENVESALVIPNTELEQMREMKAKRHEFDKLDWREVKAYCQGECKYGARLVRELITACQRIGVTLRRFDGAGSVSDALMQNNEVGQYMSAKNAVCKWMLDTVKRRRLIRAVMHAFAGGRFEAPYCGVIRKKVYAKDICSAYPYAMYLHPCLACGRWEYVKGGRGADKLIAEADLALIHVSSHGRNKNQALGSFHNRDADGNITFPIDNKTWTWKHEYLAARDSMKDRIEVREMFLYRTDCDHRPFKFMAELYLERLRIGKEGRGIALKLGYNGCAGKTMQKVGSHRWQEYIWAGNTTSRTRAQLLEAIGLFADQWDVCYLATDSVFALRDIPLPEPEGTDTHGAAEWKKPPLGAWESAETPYNGMVIVRPGIAFPLNATEQQLKEIKARGISKSVLLEHTAAVVELMSAQKTIRHRGDGPAALLSFKRRIFGGMKMSVSRAGRPFEYKVSPLYGTWYDQQLNVKLAAQPKRFLRLPGEEGMLLPWPRKPESFPYDHKKRSAEAKALEEQQDLILEQPDLDMPADYGEL